MLTFEESRKTHSVSVLGVDPGPVSSAFVLVGEQVGARGPALPEITGAWYVPNQESSSYSWVLDEVLSRLPGTDILFLAYESVGAQGKFCGESTFETAAMGGEIRRAFRPFVAGTYKFVSSDWRHALTGAGNARTPLVYHEICKFFAPTGGGADPYKGTEKQPGPLWPLAVAGKGGNVEHLKDALGVALALSRVRFRSGKDPEEYRRPY